MGVFGLGVLGFGGRVWGSGWGDQDGCERKIEVFVKIKIQIGGGGGGGGVGLGDKVDVKREVKFL